MRRDELIELLIKIEKAIYSCYKEIVAIETSSKKNKFDLMTKCYQKIKEYRVFEEQFFKELKELCQSEKDVTRLEDYLYDTYHFDRMLVLEEYARYTDHAIEARRILERIESEIVIMPEISLVVVDEKSVDFDLKDSVIGEESLLSPIIDIEDAVRFIQRMDELASMSEVVIPKEILCQFKYDMIFLHPKLENLLIKDYQIPSLMFFDAKKMASYAYHINDERLERAYDQTREAQILRVAEELSQKRNQQLTSLYTQLLYIAIGIWADSLSDEKLADVIHELEDRAVNSYSETIEEARREIFIQIYDCYYERIKSFEILEEELDEDEIDEEMQKIKKNTKTNEVKSSKN